MESKLVKKWLDLYGVEAKPFHYNYFYRYYSGFSIRNRVLLEICATLIYFSPLFLLGKLATVSSLTNEEYYEIIRKFQYTNVTFIRVIPFFVHYPLIVLISLDSDEEFTPEKHPIDKYLENSTPKKWEEFDYIVIGSGAGGAPVASELSKAGKKVCVIEKGSVVRSRGDLAYFTRDHYVKNSLDASLSLNGLTLISSGNSVGGTTSVNLGTSLVPKSKYIRELEKLLSMDKGDLLKAYEKLNDDMGVRESEDFELNKSGRTMFEWAEENGYEPFRLAHNFYKPADKSIDHTYPYTINNSTDRYHLIEGLKNGMKLIPESEVKGVKEYDNHVEVEYRREGEHLNVKGRRLIISAGALNTPNLVRENQLGTDWHEAGNNFKVHPSTSVFAYSKEYGGDDRGIPQDIGFHDKQYPEILYEGISLPPEAKILTQMGSTDDFVWWYQNAEKVLSLGFLMKEEMPGKIRNYLGENVYFYELSTSDMEKFEHGLLVLARAFFEQGAEKVLLPIASKMNTHVNVETLNVLKPGFVTSKNLNTAGFHPSGTVALGRMVSDDFRLNGSDRVFISDGSLLPDSPGVNPQLTIMALSVALAEKLLEEESHS